MDGYRYSRAHAQSQMLSDVQTRALVEELAARMDHNNSRKCYPGVKYVKTMLCLFMDDASLQVYHAITSSHERIPVVKQKCNYRCIA